MDTTKIDLGKAARLITDADNIRSARWDASTAAQEARARLQTLEGLRFEWQQRNGSYTHEARRVDDATGRVVRERQTLSSSPTQDAEIETARHQLAVAEARVARLDGQSHIVGTAAKIKDWLKAHAVALDRLPVPTSPVAVRPLPTFDELEAVRARLAANQRALDETARACGSEDECVAALDQAIDAAGGVGLGGIILPVDGDRVDLGLTPTLNESGQIKQLHGLIFRLFRDQLRPALKAELARRVDARGGFGVSRDERRTRLEHLRGERFELEADEEQIVEAMAAYGQHVARRPNADVRAILRIPEPEAELEPTATQHEAPVARRAGRSRSTVAPSLDRHHAGMRDATA